MGAKSNFTTSPCDNKKEKKKVKYVWINKKNRSVNWQ